MDPQELADEAFLSCPEIVVITGGEPAIHDLQDLAYQLRSRNLPVHLETCGAFPISGEIDWITISPKWAAPPMEETLEFADELKIIVEDEHSIAKWSEKLSLPDFNIPVWLNPEWSKSKDPVVLESINQWVKERELPFGRVFRLTSFSSQTKGTNGPDPMRASVICKNDTYRLSFVASCAEDIP